MLSFTRRVTTPGCFIAYLLVLALFTHPASAQSCSSVYPGARIDAEANYDQNQPASTCSVRSLSESTCRGIPGMRHFKRDSGSDFTECFFDPPSSSSRTDDLQAPEQSPIEAPPVPPSTPDDDGRDIFGLTPEQGRELGKLWDQAQAKEQGCDALGNSGRFEEAARCYEETADFVDGFSDTVEDKDRLNELGAKMRRQGAARARPSEEPAQSSDNVCSGSAKDAIAMTSKPSAGQQYVTWENSSDCAVCFEFTDCDPDPSSADLPLQCKENHSRLGAHERSENWYYKEPVLSGERFCK